MPIEKVAIGPTGPLLTKRPLNEIDLNDSGSIDDFIKELEAKEKAAELTQAKVKAIQPLPTLQTIAPGRSAAKKFRKRCAGTKNTARTKSKKAIRVTDCGPQSLPSDGESR